MLILHTDLIKYLYVQHLVKNLKVIWPLYIYFGILVRERESKIVNYPIFSKRGDDNIDNFIVELEKAFVVNKISNNRKHVIMTSYLKKIAANFYDKLAEIMGWNVIE